RNRSISPAYKRVDQFGPRDRTGAVRPTIVTTRLDQIDLIASMQTELPGGAMFRGKEHAALRVPCKPLHIAVAIGVDRRSCKWIVGWNFPLRRHAEDLAG